jgi:hypothetical protein
MVLPSIIIAVGAAFALGLHFFVERTHRHLLRTLSESPCPACGARYGAAAAERARQEDIAHCLEARRKHPELRINFAPYWDIRCASCGAEARFNHETETLVTRAV